MICCTDLHLPGTNLDLNYRIPEFRLLLIRETYLLLPVGPYYLSAASHQKAATQESRNTWVGYDVQTKAHN